MSTPITAMPLVSVIIPTYNLAHYIVETVESVLMQTYANLEIIIIDDGSQDHTNDVLAPFLSQINYVVQENRGISKSYNRGIEMAQGEYICFLEADDYWITTDKVEKQVAILQADVSIDYVQTGWHDVNTDKEVIDVLKMWEQSPHLTLEDWFLYPPIRLQSFMIKRRCLQEIGGFNVNYLYAMDTDLFFKIAVQRYKGAWLREITTAYRIHTTSTSHRKREAQLNEAVTILHHYFGLDTVPEAIKQQKSFVMFFAHMYFIRLTTIDGHLDVATRFAKLAITYYWHHQDFGVYDMATYLADNISYSGHPFQSHDDLITVLKDVFELPERTSLSSQLSIKTDDLLHWWLCIWWRYYHALTPENRDTDLYRHPIIFKPNSLAYYQEKPIGEIIHLARISIFVSPLRIDDKTLPTIDLFCQEMVTFDIISASDSHRLITLYFAVATRALYYSQWQYVVPALKQAIHHTHAQNVVQWGSWGKSVVGFILRKATRQV